jgi:adenine/guanine phosphoribosyltransferase-like PRPP-binding protein
MSSRNRAADMRYRLMTIDLLNLAKSRYSYNELSGLLGLQVTVLNRYVNGHVLPNMKMAEQIIRTLQRSMPMGKEIQQRILPNESGPPDYSRVISDTLLLERAVEQVVVAFTDRRITGVLTTLSEGLPLATLVAHRFRVKLVIATPYRLPGMTSFQKEVYAISPTMPLRTLYIPSSMVRRRDIFLIIFDLMAPGERETLAATMIKMVQSTAKVTGIFALISVGDGWKKRMQQVNKTLEIRTGLQVGREFE